MKQILALVSVVLLGMTAYLQRDQTSNSHFEQWKLQHQRLYTNVEEQYRRMVFEENVQMINEHNSNSQNTYTMAVNKFADMTKEEFIATYLDSSITNGQKIRKPQKQSVADSNESYDWRSTTSVRDMKSGCISSWAFSAVGTAESYLAVTKSQKVSLSVQQILDCDTNSFSCNGGVPAKGINYIADFGSTTEAVYPYISRFQSCQKDGGPYKVNGSEQVDDLKSGLRQYAVSVLVDADNWQFYSKGIFNNCDDEINLAVVAVGFNDKYWIVQGVFGTNWGESGYIYLAPGDTCGVEDLVYRAI